MSDEEIIDKIRKSILCLDFYFYEDEATQDESVLMSYDILRGIVKQCVAVDGI